MYKYFICQTKLSKTYLILPDDWSGILWNGLSWAITFASVFTKGQNDYSLEKSILGPKRMFINIIVTPLRQGEPEPTIEATSEYFEGLSYRQNLFETCVERIEVQSKEHFTAKYYRANSVGAQMFKKYCLYINKMEYLITTVLANVSKGNGRPEEAEIIEKENIYDKIVQSLYFVAK